MRPQAWKVERSRHVVHDRWLHLRADDCVRTDGSAAAPYYIVEAAPWVSILALHKGQVIVVDEYHHGAGVVAPGLPGGAVENGESPADAAVRELEEETGYRAQDVIELGSAWATWGNHTNRVHYIYAGTTEEGGRRDPLDAVEIDVRLEPVETVVSLGYLTQSFHLTHLFLAGDLLTAVQDAAGD